MAFSYDALGRVIQKAFIDDQGASYFQTHTYHGDGTLASLDLQLPDTGYADELIEYGYDSAGRGRTVTYDSAGTDRSLFSASTVDAFGRVRQAQYGATTFTATYADTGRRLGQQVNLTSSHGSRTIPYQGFDPSLRERARVEDKDGVTTTTSVTYDALGRVLSTARSSGSSTLTESFGYDALGNLLALTATGSTGSTATQLTYAAVDRDRICSITYSGTPSSGCNVAYDEVGNIVEQPTRTGSRELSYFVDGKVRGVTDSESAARFRYDAFGQVQDLVVTSGMSLDVRHDRRFGSLLEWREPVDGQGPEFASLVRKIPGPNGFEARRHGNGVPWLFQFGEARGHRFFTDENGTFVQQADYSTYGRSLLQGADSAVPGSMAYSNEQWNGGDTLLALGVHPLGARLYDPEIGRFLSRDPLVIPRTAATTNPYAFAMNDPINGSDPTGLDSCPENHCPSPSVLPCANDPVHCLRKLGDGLADLGDGAASGIADAGEDIYDTTIDSLFTGGHDTPQRVDPTRGHELTTVLQGQQPSAYWDPSGGLVDNTFGRPPSDRNGQAVLAYGYVGVQAHGGQQAGAGILNGTIGRA